MHLSFSFKFIKKKGERTVVNLQEFVHVSVWTQCEMMAEKTDWISILAFGRSFDAREFDLIITFYETLTSALFI